MKNLPDFTRPWSEILRAKQDATSDAKPVEDRIQMRKEDGPKQRARTFQLRAEVGLRENPEWSAEKIADEWGTSIELVEAIRSPAEWRKSQATQHKPHKTYAERLADELNRSPVSRALEMLRHLMDRSKS